MVCACCHLSALARAQLQVAVKHVEDWLTPLAKQQAAKCAASFLCGRHSLVILYVVAGDCPAVRAGRPKCWYVDEAAIAGYWTAGRVSAAVWPCE
ncbi:hypothetical protein ACVWXO_005495 [Bradyrhizobium sp. LM2.7]